MAGMVGIDCLQHVSVVELLVKSYAVGVELSTIACHQRSTKEAPKKRQRSTEEVQEDRVI